MLSMAGTMYFPALLPAFQSEWGITNTEAGWINGAFFGGYALAAPILVSFTDRVDPRRIYLPSAFLGTISMVGFGWLAEGTWTAAAFRLLAGVSLAGTYMPGLKALSDHITGATQSRSIVFYTSSYAIGMAASVFLAGLLGPRIGWRWGAYLLALGPLAAAVIFAVIIEPSKSPSYGEGNDLSLESFKSVLRNRPAVGCMLAYAAHCWEIFGFRSWIVAFLFYSMSIRPEGGNHFSPQNIAMIVLLMGVPSSILGNEGAHCWGRRRAITIFMLTSGLLGCIVGFCAGFPFSVVIGLCLLYGITTMLDSGSLTAGVIAVSRDGEKGMTLALYSFVGFAAAFASPPVMGSILDLAGESWYKWGLAFATLGVVCMSGPQWLRIFGVPDKT
ncbi:MAG: MFS transporter [Syntrophales bacterium]|nr:MFS transporter [Syntrophales bacterium]